MMKQYKKQTWLIFVLILIFYQQTHSFTIPGDQIDFSEINFQIQSQSTLKIKISCQNLQNKTNLNWLLFKKQTENHETLYASSSDQKWSIQSQKTNLILKGHYKIIVNVQSYTCKHWTLQVNSQGLNLNANGCRTLDNTSKKCIECQQETPFLINTNQIPLMTCVKTLIQGCQIYNNLGDNCQKCSLNAPYLVVVQLKNGNIQKKCINSLIKLCQRYTENGTQCIRSLYSIGSNSASFNQNLKVVLASKQAYALLGSVQCQDPAYPNYEYVTDFNTFTSSYQCIAEIKKMITLYILSSSNLDIFYYGTYSGIMFWGQYTISGNNIITSKQEDYYNLYYHEWGQTPILGNMYVFGSNNFDYTISNCVTYNKYNDHCIQCDSDYSNLVATDFLPFESCVSTLISGCYMYDGIQGLTCKLTCNYGDSNVVDTNVRPMKTCVESLITDCTVYTLNGTYCVCYTGQTLKAHMFTDPYSFYCVQKLLDNCELYSLYGTSCQLCIEQAYHVLAAYSINICVIQLINGCLIYTLDGSSCQTCIEDTTLVSTNYSPFLTCLSNDKLIPQCQIYNQNNLCLKCLVKLRKFSCFPSSLKCLLEINKNRYCNVFIP